MIPVDQEFLAPIAEPAPPLPPGATSTLTGQRLGDCVRACVASVLELPREDVPHFIEQPGNWLATIYGWLANRGLDLLLVEPPRRDTAEPFVIGCGMSPRGVGHAVVLDGQTLALAHDPHPSRAGLVGPPEYLLVIGGAS